MPSDSKTKIRPQQSCLKCRERKVKCDRSIPCHACIIRGLEAECTYLTTPEDREHISQAEIIDRLRREVAQLRTQLAQGPKPKSKPLSSSRGSSAGRNRAPYSRPAGCAKPGSSQNHEHALTSSEEVARNIGVASSGSGAGASVGGVGAGTDFGDGSWSGSSPSSTGTRAYSAMTVNSPGSMNSGPSESHAVFTATTAPFGAQIGAGDIMTTGTGSGSRFIGATLVDDSPLSNSNTGGIPAYAGDIPASMLMQNIHTQSPGDPSGMHVAPFYPDEKPQNYAMENQITTHAHPNQGPNYLRGDALNPNMATASDYRQAQAYHQGQQPHYPQWEHATNFAPVQQYPDSAYYSSPSSNNAAVYTDTAQNPNPNIHHSQQPLHLQSASTDFPVHENHPLSGVPLPNSWKADGKQELLEILLQTIGSCEETRVAQVVQVVRTSATPEEAVSGICQVLGISAGEI